MNWDQIEREAVDLLAEYIRIDTTNPPGNERRAVEFIGRFLKGEGLEVRYVGKDPDRINLICRIPSGGQRRGLMLAHHCDVVGADTGQWSVPPFGGEVRDGFVWGRGALDMKGMGVMELMAAALARRERLPLKRDLLLLVTCDEENGSGYGAEYLAQEHPMELEAAWCLNEGGSGWRTGDLSVNLCGFGEKGPVWVRVVAEGTPGHGSLPHGDNPCERLVRALDSLTRWPGQVRVLPETRTMLERLGLGGLSSEELDAHPLLRIPALRAMLQDTLSITQLEAGSRPNVVPAEARATLDIRVLPDRQTREVLEELRRCLPRGRLRLEPIMAIEPSCSSIHTEMFRCMERLATAFFPGALFLPSVFPAFTDSRCFRRLGIASYGWIPAMIEAADLARIHGQDERIGVEELVTGIRVIFEMISELCA